MIKVPNHDIQFRNVVSMRPAVVRTRDARDLQDLPSEGDDVRVVPDELERGRPVQFLHDGSEAAVPVDLY